MEPPAVTTPRYALAQYIPDLRRMEPRNVGVVVWTRFGVAARFLGEAAGRPGEVEAALAPPFVRSRENYRQWVLHWRRKLGCARLRPGKGGEAVPRESPAFLDVLCEGGVGNYALEEGGPLPDDAAAGGVQALADRLFEALVADRPAGEPKPRP